jgi:hypothetical protein
MHFLQDEQAYLALRCQLHAHFQPVLDFLVGTGARYGEPAGLLVRHLHLDAARPFVDIRVVLKWVGKKWKLGRPKTRSSVRRIALSPKLVQALRPLVEGKDLEAQIRTLLESAMTDPVTRLGSQHDPTGGGPVPEIVDIRTASPFDVRRVRMSVREPDRRDELGQWTSVQALMNFSPEQIDLTYMVGPSSDETAIVEAARRVRKIIEEARPGSLTPYRVATVRVGLLAVAAAVCWGWMAWEWRNVPGALLMACLVALGVHYVAGQRGRTAERLRRRGGPAWLDQKSRQELRTDRANRHRDRNVALISGGVTLVAICLTAAINKAYHLY